MAFTLPQLPYEYNALEPHFDASTMEIHHTKHHATYLKKFNAAIEGTKLEHLTLSELFSQISKHPEGIKNNGGGYFNHALFWQILSPTEKEITDSDLKFAIIKEFGTLDEFKKQFSAAGNFSFWFRLGVAH